ncbi:BarA sensory histidine kinase [Klebsiella pneumoniae]|uniref:two-component sensor histidine kinase BarA n=1 Tax=Klebsiella pneumoniae TaxID=573 RepID=UPI000E2D204D|nr:two-component sensor histidine kinase BarA [Klebsiella pneumoniae]SXN11487.1 BarA sensory histidine kinase [Klebsiella pneumoniae]
MTNYSLRARMMILILAPTVLIGLLLSIFFVAHRYNDLQRQLEDAGASIIEPLAVSSEYGMNLQNRESIGQLISVLHRRHSEIVRAISVYDSHNRLFVTSNYQLNPSELQIPKGEAFPRHLSVIRDGDMMILRTPIVSESYSPDESPESDAKMPGNMLGYVALTQRDHLTTIERSANNLLAIINDVLDFSKLEAGKLILESIPFLLRTSLDEVVTLLAHSAHDKGLELTLNIKNNVPDNVIGDPLRLQQIVTNLVGNAIKFTEHGNIDVLVEQRAISNSRVQIEIQIHDTGIGIPERDQSRLFQAFRQADASISRRHGGTGLGLVITQRLVKEMGGDISFHSQPNRGSTFWFHISLDLNPNAIPDTLNTDGLVGKRLAYVEANATAAQCTLEMLAATPLEVIYSPTFSSLAEAQYDILLVGIPVSMRDLSPHREKLAKACAMSDNVLLALPCHAQVSAEALKRDGVAACLLKPLTTTRLLPALVATSHALASAPLMQIDSHKLPMTVMAVDDNPANLKLIGALLDDLVQQVILCDSGQQAVDKAKQLQMDLILMDIQMPDMDGIRACELIHHLSHHQQTPVIAVTAHALEGQREKLLSAGMNDYLAKPIEEEKLHALLLRYQPGLHSVVPASLPPAEPIVDHNQTLDWQLALRQAAMKPDLAREMLQMLIAFMPEVRNKVEEQLVGEQPEGLVDLIHKLHGSCSYSGVPRLKKLCHTLESQLRAGTAAEDLEPELLELLDEMDNVAREACRMGV